MTEHIPFFVIASRRRSNPGVTS